MPAFKASLYYGGEGGIMKKKKKFSELVSNLRPSPINFDQSASLTKLPWTFKDGLKTIPEKFSAYNMPREFQIPNLYTEFIFVLR